MNVPSPQNSEEFHSFLKQAAAGDPAGDPAGAEAMLPIVYDELRKLAHSYMIAERVDHTLQTTALVNEAYVSLMRGTGADLRYACPNHFLAVAARAMRRVLINHAVAKKAKKRTITTESMQSDALTDCFEQRCIDLISLDEALNELAEIDSTQARIVELRFFGGMTVSQCSQTLKISERTIHYEWAHARAWLRRKLEQT